MPESWDAAGEDRRAYRPDGPYRLFVAGEWVNARAAFEAVDPTVGTAWAELPEAGPEQVEDAVAAARKAFTGWRRSSLATRQEALWRMADRIEADPDRWAVLLATEGGRPVRESYFSDVPACVAALRLFSGLARGVKGEQVPVEDPHGMAYTVRSPLGVLTVRVPWNAPLVALAEQIAPALAAGNTMVVHPAGRASATVLEFARAVEDLLPSGVLNVVTGVDERVGASLDAHPGTLRIGRPRTSRAGRTGGAMVVFEDADLDAAVIDALTGMCTAGGEAGGTPSRMIVHESVREEFAGRLAATAGAVVLGDPLELSTEMGPMISAERREEVRGAIRRALDAGARLVAGGEPSGLPPALAGGFFHAPTLLARPDGGEVAGPPPPGPVAVIESFEDEWAAVERVNAAASGRAAGVWTADLARGHRIARELDAGIVWINRWFDRPAGFPSDTAAGPTPGHEFGERMLARYSTAKIISVDLGSRRPPLWGGGAVTE
ncbi:carnitine dehydratase [Actinomadura sp. NBRC 104412]|uniref:aldehyde dehydrogenase family protein n=1 Tax=Actinomadura sp. NBRC 104412 TaxID=3032203 RepID=UPI0024A4B517|nr:aldehyde dehydrogenase family protein [Actinomadura sp. NBRC 104412]GLZ07937.1 carnitine dehydratase [Actinomadura sp. NBRC 104412]